MNRRMIPGKLLVFPENKSADSLIKVEYVKPSIDVKVYLSGKAPEGEPQIEDGQIIKIIPGGQKYDINGSIMLLIPYSQVLYIY